MRPKFKICIIWSGILLAVYVGSYWVNSASGGYWMKPDRDGRDRWSTGMSATTAILFQPAIGYHTPFGGDLIGSVYAPLIRLDRHYFRPTHYLTDDGVFEWAASLPISQIHPSFRDEAQKEREESPRKSETKPNANTAPQTTASPSSGL